MDAFRKFDLINSRLEGSALIEASAGTGKTYTITGLFLRLILEQELLVDQILVVTFTEAATEELRDRIRTALRQLRDILSGKTIQHQLPAMLIDKFRDIPQALMRLDRAIRQFDQAAIFTIHGFCKRMLDEHAFESGSLFDTELVTDQSQVKLEIVYDFWRRHFYQASPLFVRYALQQGVTPEKLFNLVNLRIMHPDFKILPIIEPPLTTESAVVSAAEAWPLTTQEQAYEDAYRELRQAWLASRQEVVDILLHSNDLHRGRYHPDNVAHWIDRMDAFLTSEVASLVSFDQFHKFTQSEIFRATKKGCSTPRHSFFSRCEQFQEMQDELQKRFEQHLLLLKIRLFHFVRAELAKRKLEKNIQSFDDLLLKLFAALQVPAGSELAAAIRSKYRAALIDEFQDTDPVQYGIFKHIFRPPESILFLIGDPKQAIYGFRGADVFAYMAAAREIPVRFTLVHNWRSEPGLIAAINAIFGRSQLPFIYPEIPFVPGEPAPKAEREYLTIDRSAVAPLQLWYIDASQYGDGQKPLSKEKSRELIYHAVAAEIAHVLNEGQQQRLCIGGRPIREQDIAVLVRRNSEALRMQQKLAQLRIPAVLFSTENLFDAPEALALQRLLCSIADPTQESLLAAALATDFIGLTGEQIESLLANDTERESWLLKFRQYHDLWQQRGFIQMFRMFLSREQVLPRLMAFVDGERRATNVLHLAEVLHQASVESKLGIAELLQWLAERRDPRTPRQEEHQLRLESDDNAVKLITIHKSKGLEYPIVFCPFGWDGSRIKDNAEYIVFHDEYNQRQLTVNLGSEEWEEHRPLAEKEQLAENLRLLYVALTRAKHRCYLVWGRINDAETSAPAYLFHQPKGASAISPVEEIAKRFESLNDQSIWQELEDLKQSAQPNIHLAPLPGEPAIEYHPATFADIRLSCEPFGRAIDSSWRVASFSSLIANREHADEIADDEYLLQVTGQPLTTAAMLLSERIEPTGIHAFPSGRKAGLFFHKIFEVMDFRDYDSSSTSELIVQQLAEYGFESVWQNEVIAMVRRVLNAPLIPECPEFTLSKIDRSQRMSEMEFYFPLQKLTPERLRRFFQQHAGLRISDHLPDHIGRLNFSPTRGFMKGIIDLVVQWDDRFYLIDWKSNRLGERLEDYSQPRLQRVMAEEFYSLQYFIYLVALNEYLKIRWPGYDYARHFGGVCYIFLRGVDPQAGFEYGIFRDRPARDLVNDLREMLLAR
ncbi:MAG: exodeoxyribonuclease V subunit beta [candidate division KSB1 bacterium]|nr:exodeoxyribonuclease V subunit beta [candidate division KSB1 bacterium]